MLRALIYILVSIFVITLLRGIIGIITKGVGQLFEEEAGVASKPNSPSNSNFGGELQKCSVCGTFAAPSAALSITRGGSTYHFCSEACRARFA